MARSLRSVIKAFFQTGDVPTEAQYVDTIDSSVYWDDDVEHTLTNDANKVPASDAVYDAMVYTKDANGNVFYNGVIEILGANSGRNIFHQGAYLNVLGDDCFDNIFHQVSTANTFGNGCGSNIFESQVGGFTFGGGLQRVTVKNGSIGEDYSGVAYNFMYSLAYPSIIFRNPENATNYHSYYDPTNERIVLTNLTTLVVSYIGGGAGAVAWGAITGTLSDQIDLQSALDGKVDENAAITGETKTKVTYDSKGLVTSGTDATTADIASSVNKRYVTDAQLTVIGNTSNTNSGNETAATIGAIVDGASAATLADADKVPFSVSSVLKYITWANFKAAILSYLTNKLPILAEIATDGAVSSTTVNTYSTGVLITPDMIDVDTSIEVITRVRKTGIAGTVTVRIYANTTNDISGSPILLGTYTSGATALSVMVARYLIIKVKAGTGAGTEVENSTFSSVTGYASITSAVTTAAIDWTSNKYIVVSVQNSVGADSSRVSFLKVRR